MKTILCFGDSNTWGYVPGTGERYSLHERWPGVLQEALGDDYRIIEEGLKSRTTVLSEPGKEYKNGKDYLVPCLKSHAPIDLVILFLGTNDLKNRYSLSARDVAANIAILINVINQSTTGVRGKAPSILLLIPPPLGKLTEYKQIFDGATAKSKELSKHFRSVALELGCECYDTSQIISISTKDGVHFNTDQHRKLGETVANIIRKALK